VESVIDERRHCRQSELVQRVNEAHALVPRLIAEARDQLGD
jgi:hypothetical protein